MKITANSLMLYWQYVCDMKSKDRHNVSSPEPLFKMNSLGDIVFNRLNYVSNDILRQKLSYYEEDKAYAIENGILFTPFLDDRCIRYIWNSKIKSVYVVGWYICKPHTQIMQVNGNDMTIEDYINALSTLGIYEWEQIPKGLRYHDEAIAYLRQLSETSSI